MHARRIGAPGAVAHLVFEPGVAVEVLIRRDGDLAVAEILDRQAVSLAIGGDEQRLRISIGIVRQQRIGEDYQRQVFGRFESIVTRDRCVLDRQHVDRDRAPDGEALLVLDRVAQRDLAEEVWLGRVAIHAVVEQLGALQRHEFERAAFGSGVIRHQHGRIDVDIAVFEHFEARIGRSDRQREVRIDGDVDVADARLAVLVSDAVVEARIAEIAAVGREDRGLAIARDEALVAVEHFDDLEAVALDIAVVGDERGEIDDDGHVHIGDEAEVVICDRCVVDRGDVEGDRLRAGLAPVGDRVAEGDRAVDVLVGDELEAAARQLLDAPALDAALQRLEAQRVAVGIDIVRHQLVDGEDEGHVLLCREDVGAEFGRLVGRGDVDRHLAGRHAVAVVGDGVFEARLAREVVIGREEDVGAVEFDRAVLGVGDVEEADRVAVDVVIVRQQRCRVDQQRGLFHCIDGVGARDRRILERIDGDLDTAIARAFAVVGDGVAEGIVAAEGGFGRVDGKGAVIAVECLAERGRIDHARNVARYTDAERCQHFERHFARDHAGSGIDRKPCRQVRTIGQRGAEKSAFYSFEPGRRIDRDLCQFEHDSARGRRAKRGDADCIAVAVEIVRQ